MEQPQWIVSVDDHIIEPPDLWVDRVATADRERAPHTIVGDDGILYWAYEAVRSPISKTTVEAGKDDKDKGLGFISSYDELLPWYYDAAARTEALDRDGVLASLCFPMFPRYCGQTFYEARDRDFGLVCLRTYNDWVIDEWAGAAPGRFIPMIIIPLWDPTLAAREIERCAGKGAKGIAFSENPARLGLPSLHDAGNYWDPVLAAANDTGMPLCVHFGSSSSMPRTSDDAPLLVTGTLAPVNLMFALVDWLFSGKLIDGDRAPYPDLKICLSEGGIGWIPYILERCDQQVERRPYLAEQDWKVEAGSGLMGAISSSGGRRMGVPPSELFRRHIYGCFIDDAFGARHLEEIGIDNVMLETDFPHGDSTYPGSLQNAHARLAGYSVDVQQRVMMGNACRVFHFEPAQPPVSL
jgi:predicted TIM-barrel fold metal-dependent hydrolase